MKTTISRRSNGTKRVRITCEGKGLTEQKHKKDVDINQIMLKASKTGMLPLAKGSPMYGDFTNAQDFQNCLERIQSADQAFMELPADIRKRFANDPAQLITYINNPENEQEAVELGLLPNPGNQPPEDAIVAPAAAQTVKEAQEGESTEAK